MNRRQKRRLLESRLHALKTKRKEINKELNYLEPLQKRLSTVIAEAEGFNIITKGGEIHLNRSKTTDTAKTTSIIPDDASGTWIVARLSKVDDQDEAELIKFHDIINENKRPLHLSIKLPTSKIVGDDGKEVTFNPGDLLSCAYEGDLKVGKHGFHFANLAPSNNETQKMYDFALGKLGLKEISETKHIRYMIVDGSFRKVN